MATRNLDIRADMLRRRHLRGAGITGHVVAWELLKPSEQQQWRDKARHERQRRQRVTR